MIWSFIKRGLVVTVAFLLSAFVAVVTFFAIWANWAAREAERRFSGDFDLATVEGAVESVRTAIEIAPAVTLLPGLAAIVLGELLRVRSALYYIGAGGAAAAVMPLLYRPGADALAAPNAEWAAVLATAGFAAGLVYWLVAGRSAR
jgi:choline-glycine betaine transporter